MNLTITVQDDVLRSARIRALQENTSITAVMRDYLIEYAGLASRSVLARQIQRRQSSY